MSDYPFDQVMGGVPVPGPRFQDFDTDTLVGILRGKIPNPGFAPWQLREELFKRRIAPPASLVGSTGADAYGRGPGEETKEFRTPSFAIPPAAPSLPAPPGKPKEETPSSVLPPVQPEAIRNMLPPPKPPVLPPFRASLDEEGTREKLMRGMPEDRKPGEVYKADPYMAMLQTGLRVLAARPQLGQSAVSQIAGPVAEGVEAFRGEKEKERLARAEEAKAAREEGYRRYGISRDVEKNILDMGEKQKQYDLRYAEVQNLIDRNADQAQIERAKLDLQRAELDIKRSAEAGRISPREANAAFERLEEKRRALEANPNRTPAEDAELDSVTRRQAAIQRAFGAYIGAEGRSEVAGANRESRQLAELDKQITDLAKQQDFGVNEEKKKRLAELRRQRNQLAARMGLPLLDSPDYSSLPPAPSR